MSKLGCFAIGFSLGVMPGVFKQREWVEAIIKTREQKYQEGLCFKSKNIAELCGPCLYGYADLLENK